MTILKAETSLRIHFFIMDRVFAMCINLNGTEKRNVKHVFAMNTLLSKIVLYV